LLSADINELERNTISGCISDGVVIVRDGVTTVRLVLAGGYLEICCGEVSITKARNREQLGRRNRE
jgi:hypothetical protein